MKHLLFVILICLFPCFPFAQQDQSALMETTNSYSEQLINRFNKLRNLKSLPPLKHDSILDLVTNEILRHPAKYQKSFNSFYEDSIRFLLYNSGVIDYKYELLEVADKDTVSVFKKFFMGDGSKHIQVGCYKKEGKSLLIKTKSYLEYGYAVISGFSVSVDGFDPNHTTKIKPANSAKYYVNALISGKYRFYYSDKIPLSSERLKNHDFTDIIPIKTSYYDNDSINYSGFNLLINSKQPYKFVVIVKEKKELVAIIK